MTLQRIQLGRLGEQQTAAFLMAQGYQILEKNFRTKCGEIDIIAKDQDTICFIEVRTKTDQDQGHPLESISIYKKRHLIRSALLYMQESKLMEAKVRFDVVAVFPKETNCWGIELSKNAFDADGY